MTLTEIGILCGMAAQTIGLVIILLKTVWGGATSHYDGLATVRNELIAKLDLQSANVGNVIANIGDRIHQLELKAMEVRAFAAETYMRKDSYQKSADEFKRDVREAHDDLKQEMHAGFDRLQEQVSAVSMSIEENRKARRQD